MKIGIIGAGISGLTAGRVLARSGHDVTVFEKSRGYGGRMSTRHIKKSVSHAMDHGVPYLMGSSQEFRALINELLEKKIVTLWTDTVSVYTNGKMLPMSPSRNSEPLFIAPKGMNSVGKYLGRWLDCCLSEKVGGITHIGGAHMKKSPWMINSSSINVFESDAVIIATPAIQAFGLVSTSQDELGLRKLITLIDEIPYSSTFSFMAGLGKRESTDWKAVKCDHPVISWIYNESSKRDTVEEFNMVVHTSDHFTKKQLNDPDKGAVEEDIMSALSEILGSWAGRPEWHETHLWRYHLPKKSLDMPFLESEDERAPLAVIGDYFQGRSLEAAYLSGLRLGEHWVDKFS